MTAAGRALAAVENHLLAWVLLAVAVGYAVPAVGWVTNYATPILAVMVGSVSLTLSVSDLRAVRTPVLGRVLVGHLSMPVLAFALATLAGLSPALTAGFVVLGAVTPELVTPVMTELADGDTALANLALVLAGVGSLAVVPAATALFAGGVPVDAFRVVEQLLVAVVLPMALALGARTRFERRVARYDDYYAAVSAAMVVIIIGGVVAANAALLGGQPGVLVRVGALAVALNLLGYGVGWLVSSGASRGERTASVLSVGMRDFAVAAALVVGAGLPGAASLPAVAFGVVEMATSAALARLRA